MQTERTTTVESPADVQRFYYLTVDSINRIRFLLTDPKVSKGDETGLSRPCLSTLVEASSNDARAVRWKQTVAWGIVRLLGLKRESPCRVHDRLRIWPQM